MNDLSLNNIFSVFQLPTWIYDWLLPFIPIDLLLTLFTIWKIIAGVASIVMIYGIGYAFYKANHFRAPIPSKIKSTTAGMVATPMRVPSAERIAHRDWAALAKKAEVATADSVTLLIVEADTIVDHVLKEMHIPGDTMADRMRAMTGQLRTLDELWEAHKVRNTIAHTPGFRISLDKGEELLLKYYRVLKELEAI